jgi:hydroxymethylbilane synthase
MSKIHQRIRVGTRASKLAIIQANEIKTLLLSLLPLKEDQIEIIPIATSGDKIQNQSLADIGGKGLFIKEIEEYLIEEKIDIAVHSAKDVPPLIHRSTKISAFTKRKNPCDYFISSRFKSIDELPIGAIVGTSSARRKSILLGMRSDLNIVSFRGNVDTRMEKVLRNEVDASVLAACGLLRLGKSIAEENIIQPEAMLPAAGQGSLILQTRVNDHSICDLSYRINDETTMSCVKIERLFLEKISASCTTPISAYCEYDGKKFRLRTKIFDYDGGDFFGTDETSQSGAALAMSATEQIRILAAGLIKKLGLAIHKT